MNDPASAVPVSSPPPDIRADWLGYRYLRAHYAGHAVALVSVFAVSAGLAVAERYAPMANLARAGDGGLSGIFATFADMLTRGGMPASGVLLFLQEFVLRHVPMAYLGYMSGYSVKISGSDGKPVTAGWCMIHDESGTGVFVPAACMQEDERLQRCLRREIPRYHDPSRAPGLRLVTWPDVVARVCREVATGRIPVRQIRIPITPVLSDALTTTEGQAMLAHEGYRATVHCGMDRIYGLVTFQRA